MGPRARESGVPICLAAVWRGPSARVTVRSRSGPAYTAVWSLALGRGLPSEFHLASAGGTVSAEVTGSTGIRTARPRNGRLRCAPWRSLRVCVQRESPLDQRGYISLSHTPNRLAGCLDLGIFISLSKGNPRSFGGQGVRGPRASRAPLAQILWSGNPFEQCEQDQNRDQDDYQDGEHLLPAGHPDNLTGPVS